MTEDKLRRRTKDGRRKMKTKDEGRRTKNEDERRKTEDAYNFSVFQLSVIQFSATHFSAIQLSVIQLPKLPRRASLKLLEDSVKMPGTFKSIGIGNSLYGFICG